MAFTCAEGSGPHVTDSATWSSVTSSATASKCAGSGSSQDSELSIAAVGQWSRAVRLAVFSSFAQQTVSSPYRGFPVPPASSNFANSSASGPVAIMPSPSRPASAAL